MNQSALLVLFAFVAFGLLPTFWALLSHVDPLIVLSHRVLWSMVILGGVLLLKGNLMPAIRSLRSRRLLGANIGSSILLLVNWFSYIVALQREEFIAASLAYYICPLLTMFGATVVLGERLCRARRCAVYSMVVGVMVPIVVLGEVPWLALIIACSWSGYTLVRKYFGVPVLEGLFIETFIVGGIVLGGACIGVGADFRELVDHSMETWGLLLLSGVATATPIVFLVTGMRGVSLATVGVLQYVTPTLSLLCSVLYFGVEPTAAQLLGLVFIWLGIVGYLYGEMGNHVTLPLTERRKVLYR